MLDFVVLSIVILLFVLFYSLPSLIIYWKLFTKAGEPGWKWLVPLYDNYIMGKIAKTPKSAWVVVIAYAIVFCLTPFSPTTDQPKTIVSHIISILSLVAFGFGLYVLSKFIQQYDAGIGKWFLFIFFPIIGVFLVGSTKYKGTLTTPTTAPATATVSDTPTFVPATFSSSDDTEATSPSDSDSIESDDPDVQPKPPTSMN